MHAKTALFALCLAALPGLSMAGDKIAHYPLADAIAAATQSGKLDGTVKFYLAGNTPPGNVTVLNADVEINRKTNAFAKADQKTCDWVMQSALIALQDQAKQAGANAVVDIVSNYDHEYSDPQNYECHIGFLMSGVIMKGKLAKLQ